MQTAEWQIEKRTERARTKAIKRRRRFQRECEQCGGVDAVYPDPNMRGISFCAECLNRSHSDVAMEDIGSW